MNRPLSLSLSFYIYGVVFSVCLCISFVSLSLYLFCVLWLSSLFFHLYFYFIFCCCSPLVVIRRISFVRLLCGKIFINGFIIVSLRVDINWHWPQWIRQALACMLIWLYVLLLLLLFLLFWNSNKESVRCLHCFNIEHVFSPFCLVSFGCRRREFGYRFKVDSKSICSSWFGMEPSQRTHIDINKCIVAPFTILVQRSLFLISSTLRTDMSYCERWMLNTLYSRQCLQRTIHNAHCTYIVIS